MKITKIKREVPIWRNKKIKSYSEINRTSEEQINFYNYLKENFLKGKYIDLEGNDNYAFILYYNLLEDYLAHRDWKLLDRQLKALEWYYKLKNNILVEMIRFKKRRDESYTFGSDLGMQFKDKLRLKEQEIEWLNRVYEQNNVFISIDGCRVAVIKQYFLVLKELNKKLKNKDTSIAKETTYLKEETKKFYEDKVDPYWGYYNMRYLDIRAEHRVYTTIFKRVENSIREAYGQKGKVDADFCYSLEIPLKLEFENSIGKVLNEAIDLLKSNIDKPDISTQIKLNAQNENRWKSEFTALKNSFSSNKIKKFIDGISLIETANQKNPNIENIFFEASKFIAKYNNLLALQYYAKYILYNLKSINFYKPLTKTNQKLLFKTEDQLFAFRKIIDELGIDSDIQKALNALSNIYIPVGKKNVLSKLKFLKIKQEVPTWSNKEIKSYSEINSATEEQINFYNYFKENFLKGKYIHLKGNSNYAYILHYHLLEDYLKHRDGELLDGQLKALDEFCYKKLKVYIHSQIQYIKRRDESRSFGSDSCNLGTRYKNKLKFNEQEIEWLNKFESPSNVFISIEECCIAVIKQFLLVLKELNLRLWKKGTSIVKETTYLKEGIKKYCEDKFDPYWGYCNKRYLDYFAVHLVYLTIFERVENSVRVVYQQRGKLKDDFFYPPVNIEFENRIGNVLNQVIDLLKDNIEKPDISTQIKLNTRFVNSWDSEFKKLTNSFSANKTKDFINGISLIRTSNKKDPKIVNVLFEASTFIAKYNKVVALQYYAKYIFDNVKKKKFNNKQITKKSQKLLFKTEEQLSDFKKIIDELVKDPNIQKALNALSKIYIPRRKKIVLNQSEIEDVKQEHSGTVELLNEYLESDDLERKYHKIPYNAEIEEVSFFLSSNTKSDSRFISELKLNTVQEQLIIYIVKNSFKIPQKYVEGIAIKNGIFKNQLIDSINKVCSDFLDGEVLIEEDEDNYIIEESYYNDILKIKW